MRSTAGFMRDSPFKKGSVLNSQKIQIPSEEGLSKLTKESSTKNKLKKLTEKWSNLQSGIENQKAERRSAIEERLQLIEDAINREKPTDDMKFKVYSLLNQMLKEQISKLNDILSTEFETKEVYLIFNSRISMRKRKKM